MKIYLFIKIARKNPFIFIDSLEYKLNIRINPFIKFIKIKKKIENIKIKIKK